MYNPLIVVNCFPASHRLLSVCKSITASSPGPLTSNLTADDVGIIVFGISDRIDLPHTSRNDV